MPERDALSVALNDGFALVAAGLRRERDGRLAADLMLQNGTVLHADRVALNAADAVADWAERAAGPGRPTAARMAEAVREYLLPDALASLQDDPKPPSQADDLIGVALDGADLAAEVAAEIDLFHDANAEPFATVPVGDHRETWALGARGFKRWLARRYFLKRQKAPNAQALADAVNVLAGRALFDGPEQMVFTRLAQVEDRIYLDLADPGWRAVEIDAAGWRVVTDPPVKFRRPRGMLALPEPVPGKLEALAPFVNLRDPADFRLVLGWLLGTLRPSGPYAVLVVHGEQGSAKSTLTRILRELVDPNLAPIRATPRDERDLAIAATNGWCLAFDNISKIPDWLSDAYCRVATGGGFATRTLYENDEETLFNSQRPIVLNGIEEVATRGDLLDRALVIYLAAIPEEARRPERELWAAFARARPGILGALLDAASAALAHEAATVLTRAPRMADFARWVTAAEPTLGWEQGAFVAAYRANRAEANDLTLEGSPVPNVVQTWAARLDGRWEGTATELLALLEDVADEKTRKQKAWPESARALSNALRRFAPNLRAAGIDLGFDGRKHGGRRVIRIKRVGA